MDIVWNMQPRIEITPDIHFGKPVIRGTRVPVTRVLAELAAGLSSEQIAKDYSISADDVRAAVAFANDLVRDSSFVTTTPRWHDGTARKIAV